MNKLKCLLLACVIAGSFVSNGATAASSSNTVVRFQIKYGARLFGNVDVELFDHDKPVTVSNFLYYVRSQSFDRSILHRVVPGFILQGGQYSVDNPYGLSLFESMTLIPEGPAITNEYNVGPVISNKFGTIAMAKIENQPNSATTSWFFNIADNSDNLDYQNGGFTVFGKIKSGSSVLNHFNSIAEEDGIINMNSFLFLLTCGFPVVGANEVSLDSLPVNYYFFDCPYFSDLFNVQISILSDGNPATPNDSSPPKVTVATPKKNQSITNSVINFTGTVTDNLGTNLVRFYPGTNSPVLATVSNITWSVSITNLLPGTNQFLVEATDSSGNRSLAVSQFFYSVKVPFQLFLATNGGFGTTVGPTNNQLLDVGRNYFISATPDSKSLFINWSRNGTAISSSPGLLFTMETNLSLTVRFDTNKFPGVKGTYNGLFIDTNTAEQRSSGFITLNLGDRGAYSAKIIMNGKTYPFSGFFNTDGDNSTILGLPGTFTRANLNVDLTGVNNVLAGNITNYLAYSVSNNITTNITTYTTNGGIITTNTYTTNYWQTSTKIDGWNAAVTADRAVFNSRTNPAPQAGKYTLVFPADTNSPTGPSGDGYGTVSVSKAGAISFAGSLADGTKVSQKTSLSQGGNWPLYLPLYKTNGSLVSWVTFTNRELTDLDGLFNWFKQAHVTKYFPGGFTNEATIAGSRFLAPNTTNRMLNLTSGLVGLTNGNLAADFTNHVTLDAKGKVTNLGTNKLSLSISSGSGILSGSAVPPTGGKAVPFKGVVLQKSTNASGYFLGTNLSGRISLDPAAP